MVLENEKINELVKQQHNLIRQFDRKEILEEEYKNRVIEIEKQIKEETKKLLEKGEEERNIEKNKLEEEIKMEEENKIEQTASRKDSVAKHILDALQMKSVKSFKDVGEKVKEKKPEADVVKIMRQAKVMVKEIVNGKGKKAQVYHWDNDNFLLVKKQ